MTLEHKHDAPPNPYHQSRRSEQDDASLEKRVAGIENLLVEKGIVDRSALDKLVDIYENDLGPLVGARVVARAWCDAEFKSRLLRDASATLKEMDVGGLQGEHMVVVENTSAVHNLVVCTLCSCYPWPVLGLPPNWYKSAAYRSKVVIKPREVLEDFGTEVDDDVEVRVWDSSAEVRYLVLPQRPSGTEDYSEEELADLVERDAMIGVKKVSVN